MHFTWILFTMHIIYTTYSFKLQLRWVTSSWDGQTFSFDLWPLPLTLEVAGWPWCYPGHCWVHSLEPCAVVWRHNTARLVQSLSPRSEWLVLSLTVQKTPGALWEDSAERSLPHLVVRATSYGPGDLETQFINRIIQTVTGYIKMEKNEQVNILLCWL